MTEAFAIVFFVILSGFFSGSEVGFYCLNRIRLRFRWQEGWPGSGSLRRLTRNPHTTISTILVGNNITHYGTTAVCARVLVGWGLVHRADLFSSLIVPPFLLVFAEILPKFLFQRRADTLMYKAAPFLRACEFLFYPLLLLLRGIMGMLNKITGTKIGQRGKVTRERLRFFLQEGTALGVLSPYQQRMADNIMRVRSLGLETALIPLEDVVMIPQSASVGDLKEVLRGHRFSRIPVYSERRENIVGVVNVIDLLATEDESAMLEDLIREPIYVDEDLSVAEALYTLQRRHQQLAVVTGEEGQAVGIVTVKDLVEEIVGELEAW